MDDREQKGLNEKTSGNNHATWWTAQVAAYSIFTGETGSEAAAWQSYQDYLVPTQIEPSGRCPKEEARTNSLSYSSMNLDAFATICHLARVAGTDLWHFRGTNGGSVEAAVRYLLPYVQDPDSWKKQQISSYNAGGYVFPGLAAIGLSSPDAMAGFEALPHNRSAWVSFVRLIVNAVWKSEQQNFK